ncbi:MAG TPA: DUF6062 family protein [Chloroflexota bacterium]
MGRTAFEMKRGLQRNPRVCPVCLFVDDGVRNHIDALFYERATDIATRATIRAARGFCRFHARLVSRQADALGTALIMQDVLVNDLRDLRNGAYERRAVRSGPFSRFFGSQEGAPERAPCPLCEVERDIDLLAVDSLLEGLGDAEFVALFRKSEALCVPHFRLAHDRCSDEQRWREVLTVEEEVLSRMTEALGELARKYDYHSHEKPQGDEADVWRRALDMTSQQIGE